MSIASKITSMTEHIGDIYDAVELTGIDTTGVNKNLVNVPNTLKDGFVDIINNGTDELYSNFPKTTGEGVEIALNNTFKAPMEIDLKGNTEQTTYTGKNLFDKNNLNTKNVYLDSSNKIIGTSSGNGTLYIPCEPNTTYTVSKTELFGDDRFCIFDTIDIPTINDYALSYEGLRSGYNNAMSLTITTSSNANYLCMFVKANTTSPAKTFEEIAETIQVEKNSTATSYEPYVGGTASPNPDYPQDIRVVKGNNTINIHGKNLFDKDNANILNASFATEKKLNSSADGRILWIACKGNTTYTISKISSTRFRILTTATTPNINVVGIDYVYGTTETSITITTSSDTKYLCVYYYLNGTDTLTEQQILDTIQIEQGSTATTYQPYTSTDYAVNIGSMELCKIGTYQDLILKSTGKNKLPFSNDMIGYTTTSSDLSNGISKTMTINAGTYTLMFSGSITFTFKDSNNTTVISTGFVSNGIKTIEITEQQASQIVGVKFYPASEVTISNFMLYEGTYTTALPYEPYGNVWYKKGYIGKVTFDDLVYGGTGGNFANFSTNGNIAFYYEQSDLKITGNRDNIFCNLLTPYSTTLWNGVATGINNYANDTKFLLSVPFSNVEQYAGVTLTSSNYINYGKNYIASLDGIIYYLLATPTTTEITDTDLINQLEAFTKANSVDEKTFISQTNADLPFIIYASALSKN